MRIFTRAITLLLIFISFHSFSTTYYSKVTGSWNTAGTWSKIGCGGTASLTIPGAGDDVIICAGNIVTMNGNPGSCLSLTVKGTANWTTAGLITNVGVGGLILDGAGIITGSATGVLNVAGGFTVPATANVTIARLTITVTGSSSISGTINITSVTGTKTFADITVNSGGVWNATVAAPVAVTGSIIANGNFECLSGTYTVSNNVSVNVGTTNFEGSVGGTLSVAFGATITFPTGNVSVTGTTTISGTLSITTATGTKQFANITVNSGGNWSATVIEPVAVTGSISSSGTFNCSAGTYTVSSNVSVIAGTTNFQGSIGGTLTISSGAIMNVPTNNCSVTSLTTVSGNLNFTTTTGIKTFADVTINNGGIWNCTVVEAFAISGNFVNNGTFISNAGIYTFSGGSKTFSGSRVCEFTKIAISGNYTNSDSLKVNTAFDGTGTLTQGNNSWLGISDPTPANIVTATATGNKVYYFGSVNQAILIITYYNVEIVNTGGTVTATGTYTVNNNFTITSGTVSFGSVILTGTLSVASGSIVNIAGASPIINGTTIISGTVNITSTTGVKTFNNIIVNSGGIWNSSVAEAYTINGNIQNDGTFTSNTGIYILAGTTKTLSGATATSISNITCNGTYTNNFTLTVSTSILGSGTFTQGTNSTLNIGATSANFAVAAFNASTSGNTVNYNSAAAQSVRIPSDGSYYHLIISGGVGMKSLTANTVINGDMTISTGTQLTVTASNYNITLKGNWTKSGVFTQGAATVTFNGTAALQTIGGTGSTAFNNLTINNSNGITLAINTTVGGILNFTSGVITTGANKISITSTGSVTGAGTSKFVNGSLEKNVATGANIARVFEVGYGATDYLPLHVNFVSVSVAGNITAKANNGDHPAIATSCIDNTKSVNRYWQLTNSGVTFTNYTATCNFIGVPTDADAGSTTANYFMSVYNGGSWTMLTQVSATANSNQGTGATTIGDLQVGEKVTLFYVVSVSISASPATIICSGTNVTFTATPTNGGGLPSYQWKLNGVNVGSNSATYSNSGLANGNVVTCVLTSNITCTTGTTATSNAVTITVNPNLPVSISIAASPSSTICSGTNVTFTATPTYGGAGPVYQWKLNGSNVGTNSTTYSNTSLANGDVVTCVLTSNATCTSGNPATSNSITENVTSTGTWLGTISTDWSNVANWCGGVPVTTTDIAIPTGTAYLPILSANSNCRNINLATGIVLSLNNKTLNVYGAFSGIGTLKGSSTSSLNFAGSGSGGTFYMDQSITGISNDLNQLTLNRALSSALIGNSLNVIKTVNIVSGTLNTGNNLTLISNATGTASIAALTAGADISGNITMQRYISSGTTGWLLLGAPVSGATLAQWDDNFTTGGFPGSQSPSTANPSIVSYDETLPGIYDNGYVTPTNITNPIVADEGYWAYVVTSAAVNIDVTGPALKNTQTFPVTYTNDITQPASENGWNLIANPYPSTIDWDAAGWTKTNVNDAIYGYSATLDQYTSYVGGIGINGGTNLIASSQGFLIQTNASSPVLKITESAKVATDATFIRSSQTIKDDILKLDLLGNGYSDETVVRFSSNGTKGFDDGLDAQKFLSLNSSVPGMATISNANNYSINALPLLTINVAIPLKVIVGVSGTYTIRLDALTNLPANACLTLEDLLTGTKTDLHTTSSYSFYIKDTTVAPRFIIHICSSAITTSITEQNESLNDQLKVISTDNMVDLIFDMNSLTNTVIDVFNSVGQQVVTKLNMVVYKNTVPLNFTDKAHGIYYIKIQAGDQMVIRKIVR